MRVNNHKTQAKPIETCLMFFMRLGWKVIQVVLISILYLIIINTLFMEIAAAHESDVDLFIQLFNDIYSICKYSVSILKSIDFTLVT